MQKNVSALSLSEKGEKTQTNMERKKEGKKKKKQLGCI